MTYADLKNLINIKKCKCVVCIYSETYRNQLPGWRGWKWKIRQQKPTILLIKKKYIVKWNTGLTNR